MRQEIVFFLLIFKKSDSRTIKFLLFANLFPRKQVVGGSALLWLGRCGNLFNCPDFLFGLFSSCSFFISLFRLPSLPFFPLASKVSFVLFSIALFICPLFFRFFFIFPLLFLSLFASFSFSHFYLFFLVALFSFAQV